MEADLYCLVMNCPVVSLKCTLLTTLGRTREHLVTIPSTLTRDDMRLDVSSLGLTLLGPNSPVKPTLMVCSSCKESMLQLLCVPDMIKVAGSPCPRSMKALSELAGLHHMNLSWDAVTPSNNSAKLNLHICLSHICVGSISWSAV